MANFLINLARRKWAAQTPVVVAELSDQHGRGTVIEVDAGTVEGRTVRDLVTALAQSQAVVETATALVKHRRAAANILDPDLIGEWQSEHFRLERQLAAALDGTAPTQFEWNARGRSNEGFTIVNDAIEQLRMSSTYNADKRRVELRFAPIDEADR